MKDPLPDPMMILAHWYALALYGRAGLAGDSPSRVVLNGIPLSMKSFILLFADPGWLLTLWE